MTKAVFRVDANKEIGIGHFSRTRALADEIKNLDFTPVFVTKNDSKVIELLKDSEFEIVKFNGEAENQLETEIEAILSVCPTLAVFDIRSTSHELIAALKKYGIYVVSFDDLGEGRYLADIVVDANLSEEKNPKKLETNTRYLLGEDYAVISKECRAAKKIRRDEKFIQRIIVSCGGSDPSGVTPKVVAGLSNLSTDVEVELILGPDFAPSAKLNEALLNSARTFDIVESPKNLFERMRKAQLGIISGGITLFEAAFLGLPSIVVCQNIAQLKNLPKFEAIGGIINIGLSSNNPILNLTPIVRSLESEEKRKAMSRALERLIDGKGVDRICGAIMEVMGR